LGFCSKLTLFKKIIYLKRTDIREIKENERIIIAVVEEERIRISITSKKTTIKLINEKKY
jgi:hypothetical protein